MSGRVEFSYSHTEELPAGGRLAAELHKALRARDEQEADVYFTLKTRDARGKERELSPLYLAYISPISRLYLAYISPTSRLHLPYTRRAWRGRPAWHSPRSRSPGAASRSVSP